MRYEWGFEYLATSWKVFYLHLMINFKAPEIAIGFWRWHVAFGRQMKFETDTRLSGPSREREGREHEG